MTIMNEIVGESGEQGEGCLASIAALGISIVGISVLAVGIMALWSWYV
jgi:hypothetical protein